ncbi:MAG: ABC transporter substrate-binding protein [Hyphomicrobiales bacterium]
MLGRLPRFARAALAAAMLPFALGFSVPAKAAEPLRILAMDVFSGPFKDIGDRYLLGIKFAVEEINAKGGINGRKIELFIEDTQLKPDIAQRRAVSQILDNKVQVIIGASGSHVVKALGQVAEKHKVILTLYAGEGDYITGSEFTPAVFRAGLSTSMHSKATVSGFVDKGYKRFYLLNQDYAFGREVAKTYKKYLDKLIPGWELAGEEYHPLATRDFAPYIQRIAASKADVVLTGNWGTDMTSLLAQARQFELKAKFGHYYLSDPLALREIGEAGIGSVTSENYMMVVDTPQNKAFIERWHKANKDGDHPWPAFTIGKAYNAMMFLAAAIEKAGTADYEALMKAWEGLEFQGLVGKQVMRACDHQMQTPIPVAEIVKDNTYYSHPFTGPAKLLSIEETSVPMEEVENPRCKK